jgi:hypothetical protein
MNLILIYFQGEIGSLIRKMIRRLNSLKKKIRIGEGKTVPTCFKTSVSDPYSFFPDPDPDPEVEAGDQYGSGSGSNPDPGL